MLRFYDSTVQLIHNFISDNAMKILSMCNTLKLNLKNKGHCGNKNTANTEASYIQFP
jgi:hypothetical protein